MPFRGFEGPAGTGKTFELIEASRGRVARDQLHRHQRLLALTFMHGSRRRLQERLAAFQETRERSSCMTIDSFAFHVLHRWRSIGGSLPNAKQFDENCDACGALLERPEVARWVVATFPVIAIDEAQELSPARLRISKALSTHADMFVAADEFQCLDDSIDTGPFQEWFRTGEIHRLTRVQRTTRRGLLDAGINLRLGTAPTNGEGLMIKYDFPNQAPFSIGHVLNAARGPTAVLVAPGAAGWADQLIPRLSQGFRSATQVVAPIRITWETAANDEATALANSICGGGVITTDDLRTRLLALADPPGWLRLALSAVDYARRARGQTQWSPDNIHDMMERKSSIHRAFGYSTPRGIPVMSIHSAKNRQFRNIIVLWSPGIPGDDNYKRRLLYNAITRAEHQCTIFVRTRATLAASPFV